ncbi:serine hydrolase [Catenuloplanes atrovinosus]|uniref:Beta-lactamase class A n=1 Tax=Catenuloplanes atrovinosus TaxID=137266 RepID=A0AAE3YM05_9ACTN|nr:serine hydrolase [Catenuloplanes atrovinosus]MDR7274311.1 beta-lactamase class A [Catenuloplanes atrovinosus]
MSTARVFREARQALDDAGLRGGFLVRDLRSGEELGIEPDAVFPAASLVKVPLAVAVLERAHRGELDLAAPVTAPADRVAAPGPPGLMRFRHAATIAVEDLLYLAVAISDGAAADALFALVPPRAVMDELRRLGLDGIAVRHGIRDLSETPVERFPREEAHLAHALAIGAVTTGQGHPIPQLDVSRTHAGSARAFADLLTALWTPSAVAPPVAARLRELLGDNVHRQRLAPDLASDSSRWSSKTGTVLTMRHEMGVVEHADGAAYAIVALTESRVPAVVQPAAEATMARVARLLRDLLRSEGAAGG